MENSAGLPVRIFWGQICNFWPFFNSFGLFYFCKKVKWNLAFFGHIDFLCPFGRFKDDFGRFLGTGRFLDTVSGHRMINFHWILCTRIYNFLFCYYMLTNLQFQVTLQQNPKVSRSSLMEWALFFLRIKYVAYILPFKSAFGCFEGVFVYLSYIWLFSVRFSFF